VERRDHRLRQIRTWGAGRHPQPVQASGDSAAVPPAAILFVERHQSAGVVNAGLASRIMQQDKGCKRLRIAIAGHQSAQFTRQPNSFVAQFIADRRRPGRRPVPLGENCVDAGQHMRRAFGQQLGRRYAQRDVGMPNLVLGPGNSLADR
jgi:hypothetical protein